VIRVASKPNFKGVEAPVRAATRRALNKIGAQGLTLTLRQLSGATGVSQKKLREYITQNRADFAELSTSIRVRAHTFNIASVGAARQTRKGVSAGAWGKRRVYPGTFLIRGGLTAMKRVGKGRLPIRPVYGPRITREFKREGVDAQLEALVATKMKPTMTHELNFALGRVGLQAR
jgi:hypothetical protein